MPDNRPGLRSTRLPNGVVLTVHRGMSDEQAAALYLLFKHEKLLPFYFHEGVPSLTDFLRMTVDPRNVFYGCFVGHEKSESVDLVGLVGGTAYTRVGSGGKLDVGMCFSRSAQSLNSEMALEFSELAIDDAFQAEDLKLLAMYGTTPSRNLAAIRFLRRLKFTECGRLPNYCTWEGQPDDAVISALTEQQWYQRKPRTNEEAIA